MNSAVKKIRNYLKMIKFSHSIFALPFALSAVVMAWEKYPPSAWELIWILVAMVSARSAAMGFNRIVDAKYDSKNERTAIREIPAGILSRNEALIFVVLSCFVFVFSAAMLSKLCLMLSIPVVFLLLFYSYTKRFTKYCHIYLGFVIGLAPAAAWVAMTGMLSSGIIFLSLGLMTYIAGFDILYACQDIEFDQEEGLFSLPSKIGAEKAMMVSNGLHVLTMIFFLAMYHSLDMHWSFLVFLSAIGGLLILEHRMVRPEDLSRINVAFFHMNSIISVLLFAGVLVQELIK